MEEDNRSSEIFKRDTHEYKTNLNPVKDWISQAATYVKTRTDMSEKESIV